MIRVFLASPFSAPTPLGRSVNVNFARRCMKDCLKRSEAPFASHLIYPQCLDDAAPAERELGIAAGLEFLHVCNKLVAYVDLGVSSGMKIELHRALVTATPIEFRRLDGKALPTLAWLHMNGVPHEECELCIEDVESLARPTLPHVEVLT